MSCPKSAYISGVLRGLQCVLAEAAKLQDVQCKESWNNSIIRNAVEQTSQTVNEKVKEFSNLDAEQVIYPSIRLIQFIRANSSSYSFSSRKMLQTFSKGLLWFLKD